MYLQISVATFKLGQVEVVQQSKGLESVIKAQISNVAVEECAAIPWDEFQVIVVICNYLKSNDNNNIFILIALDLFY